MAARKMAPSGEPKGKTGSKGVSVRSKKNGNTITTYSQTRVSPLERKNTTRVTTLGKGGRRENTVTYGSRTFDIQERLKSGDTENYGRTTKTKVLSEVQHNRGSGTRKTGSKNKGF